VGGPGGLTTLAIISNVEGRKARNLRREGPLLGERQSAGGFAGLKKFMGRGRVEGRGKFMFWRCGLSEGKQIGVGGL